MTSDLIALLENSAITGMVDLSARLIHRDWPVITLPNGCQMDTKWKYLELCGFTSLSSFHLLHFPYSLHSSFANSSSIHAILMYNADLIDTTQTRTTKVQNNRHLSCSTNFWNFLIS
jgi:hypothetical protein